MKLKYNGEETYRGADPWRNTSLTVDPGAEIDCSNEKALELLATGDFEQLEAMDVPAAVEELTSSDIDATVVSGDLNVEVAADSTSEGGAATESGAGDGGGE